MLHACALAGSEPGRCVYLGDAQRDVAAGNNAGMYTLVALFGYFREDDRPHEWRADAMLTAPGDLLTWLERFERRSTG
jgi:phosphoglycolate phosphatase